MGTLRDDLIELAARALCKEGGYDPDYVPKGRHAKYAYIDGKPVPNWKHHTKPAQIVLDTVFDYQRQRAAQSK